MLNKPLLKTIFIICCVISLNQSYAREKPIKQSRDITNFCEVEITGAGHLILKQGTDVSLSIEADPAVLAKIQSTVNREKLLIGPNQNNQNMDKSVKYYLTVKDLQSIKTYGDVQVTSQGKITADKLLLSSDGSGMVDIKIGVNDLHNKISGNGNIKIQGTAKNQNISIQGNGVFLGEKLSTESTTISISGSGNAIVKSRDTLDIKIEGSGKIEYYGNPKITQQISGDGEIIPLG